MQQSDDASKQEEGTQSEGELIVVEAVEESLDDLHGGEYTRQALEKVSGLMAAARGEDIELDVVSNAAAANATAAAIFDKLQNLPHLLDFIAQADARLFDTHSVDTMNLQQLFSLRQAAVQSVTDVMNWVIKLLNTLQPYLEKAEDDDVRRFMHLIKVVDKATLKSVIATLERHKSE